MAASLVFSFTTYGLPFTVLEGVLRFRPRVLIHLGRPLQETHQFLPFAEQKSPELQEADLVHLHAAISLDTPAQVRTAPGRKMMSTSCIPKKAKDVAHAICSPGFYIPEILCPG